MDNLTVEELKELIVFYKNKNSDLELEVLVQKINKFKDSNIINSYVNEIDSLQSQMTSLQNEFNTIKNENDAIKIENKDLATKNATLRFALKNDSTNKDLVVEEKPSSKRTKTK